MAHPLSGIAPHADASFLHLRRGSSSLYYPSSAHQSHDAARARAHSTGHSFVNVQKCNVGFSTRGKAVRGNFNPYIYRSTTRHERVPLGKICPWEFLESEYSYAGVKSERKMWQVCKVFSRGCISPSPRGAFRIARIQGTMGRETRESEETRIRATGGGLREFTVGRRQHTCTADILRRMRGLGSRLSEPLLSYYRAARCRRYDREDDDSTRRKKGESETCAVKSLLARENRPLAVFRALEKIDVESLGECRSNVFS